MIKQVRFSRSMKFFEKDFCDLWNLTTYQDINAPCFFGGAYWKEDVDAINNHKGFKVVWNPSKIRSIFILLNPDNLVVWKSADSIDHSLIEGKYKIKKAKFRLRDKSLFKPNPLGNCICCYLGNEKAKYYYGYEEVEKLRKLTKFKILISMSGKTRKQLKREIYDKSFVHFKPALIGGVETSIELALMGRKTVGIAKGEFYLLYDSIEHACEIIKEQAKNIGKIIGSVLNKDYFDTGEEWKQVKFWL